VNVVVFDLETQNLFQDVGGRDPARLRVACAVTWSAARADFAVYWEDDVPALLDELRSAERVVGFNILRFDYEVLRPYAPQANFRAFRTLDLMTQIHQRLNFRLSLDSIARATLGTAKAADGVQAVRWFRAGELDKLVEYCKADVDATRRIYEFGCQHGFVHYYSRLGSKLNVAVNWR
jgi:DEAD/DEAH box helicase domain-containing protein